MKSANISREEKNDQNKSNFIENLKSDFFLEKLFGIIKKNKSFEIMKYNKKLQKRLKLSIKDYKEYYQFYTPIEIELKPADNKYGKFINIPDEDEDESKNYFHIYFDNSKEEIKRNYLKENDKVKIIKIIIDPQIISFKSLFSECKCVSSIFFKTFKRINFMIVHH